MASENINHLISELMKQSYSAQETNRAAFQQLLDTLAERWKSDSFATNFLKRFKEKPAELLPVFEDLLREKLLNDRQLVDLLNRLDAPEHPDQPHPIPVRYAAETFRDIEYTDVIKHC